MNRPAQRQYSQVEIKTANKGKLIVLLYQGAVRFLRKAVVQLDDKDMEGKGNSLIRGQDIVLELMYALDQQLLDEGNELAQNLQRLYLYCYRRLVHANTHLDRGAIEEVIEPFLIQAGFVQRTPRGRVVSTAGFRHLGLAVPAAATAQFDLLAGEEAARDDC